MELINAKYEILSYPAKPLEMIESVARTCYKSEAKMTPESAEKFVAKLIQNKHLAMVEFGGMIIVKFIVNRGVTHEIARHRQNSDAQESTRYCNYSKSKFGNQITCIDPYPMLATKHPGNAKLQTVAFDKMLEAWTTCERIYLELIDMGITPEEARSVLPIGLKSEMNIGANTRQWRHILMQRTSSRAHPQMREVMVPLLAEFRNRTPVLWDNLDIDN